MPGSTGRVHPGIRRSGAGRRRGRPGRPGRVHGTKAAVRETRRSLDRQASALGLTHAGPGPDAVLKLMIPRPGDHARNEITVLRLAGGDGCVRLLRADEARGALLLERLGRPLHQLGLPLARRLEIMCATVAALWRPVPS